MVGAGVTASLKELVNEVSMRALQLNPVKSGHFCQFHTFLELLLGLFNFLNCHLVRHWGHCPSQIPHLFPASDRWGSPGFKPEGHVAADGPACVGKLDEDLASVLVHAICHQFPPLRLLFRVKTGRALSSSTPLAPGSSLSEDKSCCGSLGVILGDHRGGDTCQGASLSSECRHDDSARKLQVANLYLVAPACLLMIHRTIIRISTKIKKIYKKI